MEKFAMAFDDLYEWVNKVGSSVLDHIDWEKVEGKEHRCDGPEGGDPVLKGEIIRIFGNPHSCPLCGNKLEEE